MPCISCTSLTAMTAAASGKAAVTYRSSQSPQGALSGYIILKYPAQSKIKNRHISHFTTFKRIFINFRTFHTIASLNEVNRTSINGDMILMTTQSLSDQWSQLQVSSSGVTQV